MLGKSFKPTGQKIKAFVQDRRGIAAFLVTLMIIPLLAATGVAIEYGQVVQNQARLTSAADSASLIATTTAANAYNSGSDRRYIETAKRTASSWFSSEVTKMGLSQSPTTNIVIDQNGNTFTTKFNYSAQMPSIFGKFFGGNAFTMNGVSSTTNAITAYTDISIMMDTSSSMGIAASIPDMRRLDAAIKKSKYYAQYGGFPDNKTCTFGCHFSNDGKDFYGVAKSNHIPIRLDVLTDAVKIVLSEMQAKNSNSQFRIGLYTFDRDFQTSYPMSYNINRAYRALANITLPFTSGSEPDTFFSASMQALTDKVGLAGDGSQRSMPRKIVFLITDGMTDFWETPTIRTSGPIDPAACNALKQNGVRIMVLNTRYIPLVGEFENPDYVRGFGNPNNRPPDGSYSQNEIAMQNCASSPSDFYSAASPADINASLQKMINVALTNPGHYIQ